MLTLADIMTREVTYANADTPLSEVVAILRTEGITGVPVVARENVIGVISASDILEFTERAPEALDESAPQEWADSELLDPEAALDEWADPSAESVDFAELEEDLELYDTYTAADIMTRKVTALPSGTPLITAARQMLRTGVHRVLVIDDGVLVGIATSMDFLRAIAEGKLTAEHDV